MQHQNQKHTQSPLPQKSKQTFRFLKNDKALMAHTKRAFY